MSRARPLRFLALVICAWVGGRALILNLADRDALADPVAATAGGTTETQARSSVSDLADPESNASVATATEAERLIRDSSYKTLHGGRLPSQSVSVPPSAPAWLPIAVTAEPAAGRAGLPTASAPPGLPIRAAEPLGRGRRWSGSAWLLLRDDRGAAALVPGGTLGGSQTGARLAYRIGRRLALSGRIYLPLRRSSEAEVAAGLDWQPSTRLPLHLLAERRQDLGGAGRSAFALTVYGGASGRLPGGLRAEAYGQAGMVGTRSRDLFADGSIRVALPIGPVEVGGGAWGAAQPGAVRLDAGPAVTYGLPVRGGNLRLQADWRFRIAGDAAPGSGPALTVTADF